MKKLLILDSDNYANCSKTLEKTTTRGVIFKGDKLAMQQDAKGLFKMPGGGVEGNESLMDCLKREVAEETGLVINEDSVHEIGEITEVRQDIFDEDTKYTCHTLYYWCQVSDETVPLNLTESEKERGFHLSWATPEEIYNQNVSLIPQNLTTPDKDLAFIKMLMDSPVDLAGNLKQKSKN